MTSERLACRTAPAAAATPSPSVPSFDFCVSPEWRLEELDRQSPFLRPLTVKFTQRGKSRSWDCFQCHDSVYVLLHNRTRDTLVFVRQFRPAVFLHRLSKQHDRLKPGDWGSLCETPVEGGVTLELCAGIVDKPGLSAKQIAREEILEECGYDVPLSNIQAVNWCRANSGTSGDAMTLFYACADDEMRVAGAGGGVENEVIQVVEMGVKEAEKLLSDNCPDGHNATLPTLYGVQWFLANKNKTNNNSKKRKRPMSLIEIWTDNETMLTLAVGALAWFGFMVFARRMRTC